MDIKFWIVLAIGTVAMIVTMLNNIQYYNEIAAWKGFCSAIVLTMAGLAGAKLMYAVENGGRYSGTSFYGAVFFAPVLMIVWASILNIKRTWILDLCAPAECIMLMVLKIQCQINGCCYGRIIFYKANGEEVIFPSQIAEAVNGFILFLILEYLIKKKNSDITYMLFI